LKVGREGAGNWPGSSGSHRLGGLQWGEWGKSLWTPVFYPSPLSPAVRPSLKLDHSMRLCGKFPEFLSSLHNYSIFDLFVEELWRKWWL